MKLVFAVLLLIIPFLGMTQNPGSVGTANLTAWFNPDGLALGDVSTWTTTFPIGANSITVTDALTPFPQATNTPAGDISNYNTTIDFSLNTLANLQALQNTSATLDLLDNSAAGDEGTFFCVYYKPTSSPNNHMLLYNESAGASDAIQFRNLGASGRLALGKGLGTSVNATRNWTEAFAPTIISYTGNRSGLATMTAYETSLEITTSSASQSSGATGIYMGIMPGNANSPYNGYLSEYIFYNTDLTSAEMARVHSYLAIKYGITLKVGGLVAPQGDYVASTSTDVWVSSFFPLFHNDVIGIARDDSTGLLQKQSHAFDDNYRLYLDVLQTTNVANTGVFADDTSYVMMGHNNDIVCATAASNLEVPAAPVLFSRLAREWKVTKTNFNLPFNCDFVLDPCATSANFEFDCMRLLVDNDDDFTNATVYDASSGLGFSYAGGVVTVTGIANLHIPDDSTRFITLASVNIPTADLGNDTVLCAGQNLILDVTTPTATYLWQDNSTNPTFNVIAAGTYWVTVSNGVCDVTDSIIVSSLAVSANLGNDTTICENDSLLLDVTTVGASYLWQDNSTDSAMYVSLAGTYWVELSISGCMERDSIDITVTPLPIFDLGNDTTLCENELITLDATANAGAVYLWQDNSANPTFDVSLPGIYNVEVTENMCTAFDTIEVLYNIIPVDLGNDSILCDGETLNVDATLLNATYLWQDNSVNADFDITTSGIYWVDVTVDNCTERDSIVATFNPLPNPILGNDTTLCENETLLLDATELNVTYEWQDASINATFNVITAGTYWVESNLNGCFADDTIIVAYTQLPVVNLGPDFLLCAGETEILDANNAGATYLWQDNSTNATLNVTTAGQYYVDVTRGNCTVTDTVNFDFYQPIILNFTTIPTLCVNQKFVFTHDLNGGTIASSTWTFGDGQTSNQMFPEMLFHSADQISVTLDVVTNNGCPYQFTTFLTVVDNPVADFSYTPDNPLKEKEVEFTNLSEGTLAWEWKFGTSGNSVLENPVYTYFVPGPYQVTQIVFNQYCSDTIVKTIAIGDELLFFVPNAFTPNSGTTNLEFLPIFTSGFDPYDYHLAIYNRYGELLFESYDHTQGWDGRYNDKVVPLGVYIWQIRYSKTLVDKNINIEGHVTVIE